MPKLPGSCDYPYKFYNNIFLFMNNLVLIALNSSPLIYGDNDLMSVPIVKNTST